MRRASVRQADIQRAIRAAKAHDLTVTAVEIGADGAIRVLTAPASATQGPADELEAWRARRAAREAQGA
jgi:hypothetical protein